MVPPSAGCCPNNASRLPSVRLPRAGGALETSRSSRGGAACRCDQRLKAPPAAPWKRLLKALVKPSTTGRGRERMVSCRCWIVACSRGARLRSSKEIAAGAMAATERVANLILAARIRASLRAMRWGWPLMCPSRSRKSTRSSWPAVPSKWTESTRIGHRSSIGRAMAGMANDTTAASQ